MIKKTLKMKKKLMSLYNKRGCMCGHFEWCTTCDPSSKLNRETELLEEKLGLSRYLDGRFTGYGRLKDALELELKGL